MNELDIYDDDYSVTNLVLDSHHPFAEGDPNFVFIRSTLELLETITVVGDADLVIKSDETREDDYPDLTIDASLATGDIEFVTEYGDDSIVSVTTGIGADFVLFDGENASQEFYDGLEINVGEGDDIVQLDSDSGASFNDVSITLGDGQDIVDFSLAEFTTGSILTVTDFELGADGDILFWGANSPTEIAGSGDVISSTAGVLSYVTDPNATGDITNVYDAADVAAALQSNSITTDTAAADGSYLLVGDGTDAAIYWLDLDTDGVISSAEMTLTVELPGVGDLHAVASSNFEDYSGT